MRHLFYFLLFTFSLTAQTGYKTASTDNDGKAFWNIAKPDVSNSEYRYYIRYEFHNQIVNLYSNDSLYFDGEIITYLLEAKNKSKDMSPIKYVYEKKPIDSISCRSLAQRTIDNKIYSLPNDEITDNQNNPWEGCEPMVVSYKAQDTLITKSYNCMWFLNPHPLQVKALKDNYMFMDSILNFKAKLNHFISLLPRGTSYYLYEDILYLTTKHEAKKAKKAKKLRPQREYVENMQDTIRQLLRSKLAKIQFPHKPDCNGYILIFSKEGKLKRVKPPFSFWEKLTNNDNHKCRRAVKQLFKNIRLEELNLQYGFKTNMSAENGDIQFYGFSIINDPLKK